MFSALTIDTFLLLSTDKRGVALGLAGPFIAFIVLKNIFEFFASAKCLTSSTSPTTHPASCGLMPVSYFKGF